MRILVLSNLYPPLAVGGYERAAANVAEELFRRGHELRVLTSWSHLPQERDPHYVERSLDLRDFVPYHHGDPRLAALQAHESRASSCANTLRVIEALRSFLPDLVYVWNLYGIGIAAIADLLNTVGVPWVVHLMDKMPVYLREAVPPHILDVFHARDASLWEHAGVIAMSTHLLEEILDCAHIRLHERAAIIPGWVDLAAVGPHEPYRRDGVTRFVTAGAVAEHKGTHLILEAAATLRQDAIGDFIIDVFGDGAVTRFVDQAERLGVADLVRFAGLRTQPELLHAYASYDAFLFPTWEREPFGFAPLEAAGCGTPPIMTRECGAAERLVADVHCVKIPRRADALAAAMRRVIRGEIDIARLGAAGAALVAQDLTFARAMDAIEQVLAAHRRPWSRVVLDDARLSLLAFVKHELAMRMRFA